MKKVQQHNQLPTAFLWENHFTGLRLLNNCSFLWTNIPNYTKCKHIQQYFLIIFISFFLFFFNKSLTGKKKCRQIILSIYWLPWQRLHVLDVLFALFSADVSVLPYFSFFKHAPQYCLCLTVLGVYCFTWKPFPYNPSKIHSFVRSSVSTVFKFPELINDLALCGR